jgi:enoyl-CoA hydratase/carnithine racemase
MMRRWTAEPMPEPDAPTAADPQSFGFERIRYAKDAESGVATVTIDRQQVLNAFDFRTMRELGRAFEDASWDDAMAVVVVTGAGERAFCTGADLDEQALMGAASGQYWRWMGAFIELQMACDLAVMVDDAYIRHVGPEHGSVPAGGATQWLPILVGDRRAREIVMLCEEVPAARALEWGLVSRVVPRAALDSTVAEMAASLRAKLPEALRYTKTQLNWWRDLVWSQTVTHARDWLAIHSTSDETREAVAAFHEKRPPRYDALRRLAGEPRTCPECGATGLPAEYAYCGVCAAALPTVFEAIP